MNDTTNTTAAPDETVIEGAIVEVKPDNSLVVLDPTRYATELFAPFAAELATAKRSAARKPYDVNTDAGMVTAKELRTTFVKIRTRADKAKSEAKKPIDQAGKKILEIYNAIEAAAKAEEKKHNDVIVAREAEIAAEAQRKLDAERARIEAIESRVASIRSFPDTLAKADSVAIDKALAALAEKQLLPADYQEYLEDALTAFNTTVDRLREMLTLAQEREAAQRKAEEDARELARLKAESAEREKREAEERQQREADEKAKADAAAKFAADQAQMIADLQAKLAAATVPAPAPAPEPDPTVDAGVDVSNIVFNTGNSDNGIVTTGPAETSVVHGNSGNGSGASGNGGNAIYRFVPEPTSEPKPTRPSDANIITSVAIYFDVPAETAIQWLSEIDYAAARETVKAP